MRRAALAVVLLLCGIFPLTAHASGGAGSFDWYSYTNASGTRTYKVYVPPSYDGRPMPLIVDLHGCNPDSAPTEARWSRFNQLAAQRGLLVAYPQQDPSANGAGCWNWFEPADQTRDPGTTVPVQSTTDTGEPSMIAGITRSVMSRWHVDARRVYVGGISAGGAMADVMAATYPDLYAAALVYAGCEYLGTTCTEGPAALPPSVSGQLAYQAMGPRARVVPVIVIHGTADEVVPYSNGKLIVEQFLHSDAWAVNGSDTAPAVSQPDHSVTGTAPGGQTYIVDEYHDAAGCLLATQWSVVGMLHAWSDGASDGSTTDTLFTDPSGPDVTAPIVDFLLSHPMPVSGRACHQERSVATGAGGVAGAAGGSTASGIGAPNTATGSGSAAAVAALLPALATVALLLRRRRHHRLGEVV